MIKLEELTNPHSCLNKAKSDEMLFVLLGRDPAAPAAIRAWIEKRIFLKLNERDDLKIVEAELTAKAIEALHPVQVDELAYVPSFIAA